MVRSKTLARSAWWSESRWPEPGVLTISTSRPWSRKKPSSRATSSGRSWMAFIMDALTFFMLSPYFGKDVGFQETLDDKHERDRRNEQDQRGNRRDLVVPGDACGEHEQRQGDDVGHADEEGAGELVERLQEHEDRARHDARRGERQADGEESAQPRGAEIARRQLEVAVDG